MPRGIWQLNKLVIIAAFSQLTFTYRYCFHHCYFFFFKNRRQFSIGYLYLGRERISWDHGMDGSALAGDHDAGVALNRLPLPAFMHATPRGCRQSHAADETKSLFFTNCYKVREERVEGNYKKKTNKQTKRDMHGVGTSSFFFFHWKEYVNRSRHGLAIHM